MQTPARPTPHAGRRAALAALAVLALVLSPLAVRAAHGPHAHGADAVAGLHHPVATVARAAAHACQAAAHVCLPASHSRHAERSWTMDSDEDEDGFRWSFYDGATRSTCGASDDGVRELARSIGGGQSFLWVSRDGDEWLIRDRALVERARASIDPMRRLGKEMGRIGGRQGALGARQGHFGAELGRLGAAQGRLGARLALLSLREDDEDVTGERERDRIHAGMRDLERQMREVERRMHAQGDGGMAELGRRLGELGGRMGELSRRADRELRQLSDEAVSSGRARRLHVSGDI
jgi:hypothetical protein